MWESLDSFPCPYTGRGEQQRILEGEVMDSIEEESAPLDENINQVSNW